jgi:hypothetical protein
MQNAETVLSILREPRSSHRRAGRSETIISGSGGGRREQDHASDTSPDGLPRATACLTAMWELLAERGILVDHVTVYRWVQRFTPAAS